jgi:S-adenosylmethionine:tRNA ribosyltransferase-isomerase
VLAQVRASKSPKPGNRIRLADAFDVTTGERAGEFFTLALRRRGATCSS